MNESTAKIEKALRGEILYGDDFSEPEIASWFEDEREGYFSLYYGADDAAAPSSDRYEYDQLAYRHGYKFLPETEFPNALGIGSAHGAELKPILKFSKSVTVLEPSDGFSSETIDGKPVTYVKPRPSGLMPFASNTFDIVICFSVLHHIPNVTTVINEMFRVLKPGGYVLLREPTHSMGDWRHPRTGLTKRERGIPLTLFRQIVRGAGFSVDKETQCMFSLMTRLSPLMGGRSVWTSEWIVRADKLICALPVWSRQYGAERFWHKIRPTAVAYLLRKP